MSQDPDFARLRAALHRQAPSPEQDRQQQALALALANFDAKPQAPRSWNRLGGWRLPIWMASAMAVGVAVVAVLPQAPMPHPVPASQTLSMPKIRAVEALPLGLEAPVWQDLRRQLASGTKPRSLDPVALLEAFGINDPDAVMRHVVTNRPPPTDLAVQIASLARLLQGDPDFADLTAPPLPEAPQIAELIERARALSAP